MVWVKFNATTGERAIINKFNHFSGFGDDSYNLGIQSGNQIRWQVDNNASDFILDSSTVNFSDGKYHHFAGTFSGSVMQIYFDGVSVGTQTVSGTVQVNMTPLLIGAALG